LVIRVTITQTGLLQQIFHTSKTYEIPVTLNLHPDLAATISLEAHHPHYDWVPIGQAPGETGAETPNMDGCTNPDSLLRYS
jgi:hypothetical protein